MEFWGVCKNKRPALIHRRNISSLKDFFRAVQNTLKLLKTRIINYRFQFSRICRNESEIPWTNFVVWNQLCTRVWRIEVVNLFIVNIGQCLAQLQLNIAVLPLRELLGLFMSVFLPHKSQHFFHVSRPVALSWKWRTFRLFKSHLQISYLLNIVLWKIRKFLIPNTYFIFENFLFLILFFVSNLNLVWSLAQS